MGGFRGDRRPAWGYNMLRNGGERMEDQALAGRVLDTICAIAFADGGGAQQVRCLELLTKLLGIQGQADGQVTIVEDI